MTIWDVNPWHGDPYVWAALKTGVNEILDFFKPKELMPAPTRRQQKISPGGTFPAESVGRIWRDRFCIVAGY